MTHRTIWWVRRDLRLSDNLALHHALTRGAHPIPVYVHAQDPDPQPVMGAASGWWLHHALAAFDETLRAHGSRLIIVRGPADKALRRIANAFQAREVVWNRVHEPAESVLSDRVAASMRKHDIATYHYANGVMFEPGTALSGSGTSYKVFTAYWNARCRLGVTAPQPAPAELPDHDYQELSLADLTLPGDAHWAETFHEHWQPGEASAWRRVHSIISTLGDYDDTRNFPSLDGTTRLSPHLHFGEISARELESHLHSSCGAQASPLIRQLAWREFAIDTLFNNPQSPAAPLRERFNRFPWRKDYEPDLQRWQRGLTGIPIVDAGMRELWQTGWMHNRVRMIVASLLIKNLLIPWTEGADWFADTLLDADLANNTMGWQWVAGCGVDAAPYHRIFNPVRQGERFDAAGDYVRRWVPELAQLPDRFVHAPWQASSEHLAQAGVALGRDYPAPIVDLAASRHRALAAMDGLRAAG